MSKFIIHAYAQSGTRYFYTDKMGEGWIAQEDWKAFRFDTQRAAQRKANAMNRGSWVTCLRFSVLEVQ